MTSLYTIAEVGPGGWRTRSTALVPQVLGIAMETSGFPQRRGSSTNHRWAEVRRGFRVFHLVPRLLVPETACCFSRFESEMPQELVSEGISTCDKKGNIIC